MPSFNDTVKHTDRPLSNFALAYENKELIGLKLMPEIQVEKPSDKYFIRNRENGMQAGSGGLKISGSMGAVAQLEVNATTATFSCEDYGQKGSVAVRDELETDAPLNAKQEVVMDLVSNLRLEQEIRIAAIAGAAASYATANKATLSGTDRWDTSTGTPLAVIDQYKAQIWRSPNTKLVAFCDMDTWVAIRKNPEVLERIKGGATAGNGAFVARAAFASYIEVDEFYVGEAWKVATNPGATVAATRVWPKAFGIVAVATSPSPRSLHFGSSFSFLPMEVSTWFDPAPGTKGAWWYKAAHSVDEKAVASDAGMLITTPVS